jgi:hypothetical protein
LFGSFFGTSKTTNTLLDQGISVASTTIGNAIVDGITASAYQTVQSTKTSSALFGLISSTKTTNNTTNTPLPSDFTDQIQSIVGSLRSTVLDAATKLGIQGAGAVIDSLSFSLGNISFKDMTGSQIQDTLNQVFSALGDNLAAAAVPQIASLEKVGEGALQTLSRLVQEYTAVDDAMASMGKTFATTGLDSLAARDQLVQLAGGLDQFTSQAQFFVDNFISSSQALIPIQKAVNDNLASLGITGVTTKDQFAQLVQGIDVSTTAGAALYTALMAVAPAFAKVADAATSLADSRTDLEVKLLNDQGSALAATNLQRQKELAALDASLRPLQNLIYATEDLNAANAPLLSLISSLKDFQATLNGSTFNSGNILQTYATAKAAFISNPTSATGTDFLNASKAASATSAQYNSDLALVKTTVQSAIDAAQSQVDIATQQLNALGTINTSVLTVAQAVENLNNAQVAYVGSVPGHASGLARVPYDNYLMRAHKDEAVLTSSQAADWRSGRSGSNDNAALLQEIRGMRSEQKALGESIASDTSDTKKLLRRVSKDGSALVTVTA